MKRIEEQTLELSPEIKRQIFEKILERIRQLSVDENGGETGEFCSELNPDVIVILSDQTVIFEAQNEHASALLRQKCGWDTKTFTLRERILVHPSQSQKLIAALSAANLKVAC